MSTVCGSPCTFHIASSLLNDESLGVLQLFIYKIEDYTYIVFCSEALKQVYIQNALNIFIAAK